MTKIGDQIYLTAMEAASLLQVSYKTVQRWAEGRYISVLIQTAAGPRRQRRQLNIQHIVTPMGQHFYCKESLEQAKQVRDEAMKTVRCLQT